MYTFVYKCTLLYMNVYHCLTAEAVFARCLSSLQGERIEASKQIQGPSKTKYEGDKKQFINDIKYVSTCIGREIIRLQVVFTSFINVIVLFFYFHCFKNHHYIAQNF